MRIIKPLLIGSLGYLAYVYLTTENNGSDNTGGSGDNGSSIPKDPNDNPDIDDMLVDKGGSGSGGSGSGSGSGSGGSNGDSNPPQLSAAANTFTGLSMIATNVLAPFLSYKMIDMATHNTLNAITPMPEDKTIRAISKEQEGINKKLDAEAKEKTRLENEKKRLQQNGANQIDIDNNARKLEQSNKRTTVLNQAKDSLTARKTEMQSSKSIKQSLGRDLQKTKGTIFAIFDIIFESVLTTNLPITRKYYQDCRPGETDLGLEPKFHTLQVFTDAVPLLGGIFNMVSEVTCYSDGANENEENQNGVLYPRMNAGDYFCLGPLCHKNYANTQFMDASPSHTNELITVPTKSVIGSIPTGQPPGTVKDAALFYANPGPNWFVRGGVAYESCQPGFTDTWSRCELAYPATQLTPPIPEYEPCHVSNPGSWEVGRECWAHHHSTPVIDCIKHPAGGGQCHSEGDWGKPLWDPDHQRLVCSPIIPCGTTDLWIDEIVRSSVNRNRYCSNPNEEIVAGLCQPKCDSRTTRQGGLCAAGYQRASHPTPVVPAICDDDRFDFQGLCYKKSDFDSPGENKWGIRSAGIAYLGHQELDRRDREDPKPKGGSSWVPLHDDLATLRRARWDRGAGRPLTITSRVKDKKTGLFDPFMYPTCKSLKDANTPLDYDNPKVCRDETPPGYYVDENALEYIVHCDNIGFIWTDLIKLPANSRSGQGSYRVVKNRYIGDKKIENVPHSYDLWTSPGIKEFYEWGVPTEPDYKDGTLPSDGVCNLGQTPRFLADIDHPGRSISKRMMGRKPTGYSMGQNVWHDPTNFDIIQNVGQGTIPIVYGWYGGQTADGFYHPDTVAV